MLKKQMNFVQLTGKLTFKRYNDDTGRLELIVQTIVPRKSGKIGEIKEILYNDSPRVLAYGETAIEMDQMVEVGEYVTVIGRLANRSVLRQAEGKYYIKEYEETVLAETLFVHGSRYNVNNAIIAGEIAHVYRNDDSSIGFYVITVDIDSPESERPDRVNVTYFDSNIEIFPDEGDFIYAIGSIRVKRKPLDDGSEKISTSMVAANAFVLKEEGGHPEEAFIEEPLSYA